MIALTSGKQAQGKSAGLAVELKFEQDDKTDGGTFNDRREKLVSPICPEEVIPKMAVDFGI